jgi:hypothetical protein
LRRHNLQQDGEGGCAAKAPTLRSLIRLLAADLEHDVLLRGFCSEFLSGESLAAAFNVP